MSRLFPGLPGDEVVERDSQGGHSQERTPSHLQRSGGLPSADVEQHACGSPYDECGKHDDCAPDAAIACIRAGHSCPFGSA